MAEHINRSSGYGADQDKNAPLHAEEMEDYPISSGQEQDNERKGLAKALLRKQDKRIIPLCATVYLLCYLDRSNIGNARTLNADKHHDLLSTTRMTNYQYIVALMLFLVAYAIFEVPSNYFLKKTSPSSWIAFLMFAWGSLTIGLGGANNFATVSALRFLLGTFEAGLFPGLVYYVTFWYRPNERSLRVALFFASATLAGAFGGVIAYAVGHMDGVNNMPGWRWLFILEGIPSVVAAFFVYFLMPDYPETAKWLSSEEKALAEERLRHDGSHASSEGITWRTTKETLSQINLWLHFLIFFLASPPFSSLSLFTPTITAGLGFRNLEAQLMTVPPYAAAYVCMIATSIIADRYQARGLVISGTALIGAAGYAASAILPAHAYKASSRYGSLIVAACGTFSCVAPLFGWLSANTKTTAAAGLAIALNVSFGAPGQILGVWIYKSDESKIGFPTGHWTNAGCLFGLSAGALALTMYYRHLNTKLRGEGFEGRQLYAY